MRVAVLPGNPVTEAITRMVYFDDINGREICRKIGYNIIFIGYFGFHEKGGIDLRIAICDDDIRDHAHFINALHTWDPASRPERFYTGKDLLEAVKKQSFDIVFLDIYLSEGNGIEIATEIKNFLLRQAWYF